MKAVIRISTRLRSTAPIPREFHVIQGLEHLGMIYQGKIIAQPEEFNETLAAVTDRRFANRGCDFFPYMLTAEDEAKMNAIPETAPVEFNEMSQDEIETQIAQLTEEEESPHFAEVKAKALAILDKAPAFILDGNRILMNGERIAGLFGEDKQLRVTAAHAALRPEIEAWLQTITITDP